MVSTDGGTSWEEQLVPGSVGCVHMNLAVPADGNLLALYRSRWVDSIYAPHSEDGGHSRPVRRNLEVGDGYCLSNNSREGPNREFSYPSIHQGRDGALHLAYTYFRQAIKYVRVDPSWVYEEETN